MEYTKSEIGAAKKRIKHELKKIEDWLPSVPNNWMGWVMITSSLEALKYVLNPLKTHIIDNDDFDIAIEINNLVSPVWDDYFGRVNSKELEAHSATWEVYDLIKDLRDWIGEYEAEHPKTPTTKQGVNKNAKQAKTKYSCNIKEDNARKIFGILDRGNYIANDTEVHDWLVVCGVEKGSLTKKIDWLQGQNELVYFVYELFHETNQNDIWAITSRVFTINGEVQKTSSLRVANSKFNISDEKKVKLDKILKYK